MRNKILLLVVGILLMGSGFVNGQDANLEWAKRMGGATPDNGNSIAVDANGNVYTTGHFYGTVDFDPGSGIFNLASAGQYDIFISKLDASGTFLWAKRMGGTGADYGYSIAVDVNGNIYTSGRFQGTADFNPGSGIVNLTSAGSDDIFISKLDTSGAFLWAKRMGGTGADYGNSITVDANGNVYTTGQFVGTVDFDPGLGIANLTGTMFISKLDTFGAFLWAKSMMGGSGRSIAVDTNGNVYTTGSFSGTVDFDPGVGIVNLTSVAGSDIFISKLDASGVFLWAKGLAGGGNSDQGYSITVDANGNVYTTGFFWGTVDFDPGSGIVNLTSAGNDDIFISKLDTSGAFLWAKRIGGTGNPDQGHSIAVDANGNIYTTGSYNGTVDFDPGTGIFNLISTGGPGIFISKLDASGAFLWAKSIGNAGLNLGKSIAVDANGNVYTTGYFDGTVDFDPNTGIANLTSAGGYDIFVLKLNQKNITGLVYQDFNQNCIQDTFDVGLANRILIINPGNLIVTTNDYGLWDMDSLPTGNYTITADTSSTIWQLTCPITQNFTVVHPDSITIAPAFGFVSTNPCSAPDISIHAPFLRPGFSNQKVYVQACNQATATGALNSAYAIVELDALLTIQSSSQAYTNLGNNRYQVNLGTIYPGYCVDFWLNCTLSANATIGQTLCMNAKLYPVDSCALDSIPNPYPSPPVGSVSPCTLPWDRSSLRVEGTCVNDSIRFVVYNTGALGGGNMDCYAPVRIYVDGIWILLDSIQLQGGDSIVFMFAGDGRTWRLEADQHPLHPGNSHPNATVELCGNPANWTSNLVNILPHDDADPIIDIYCGLVTGSYDPNDKTGYPLGVGTTHDIQPNQEMDYVIRFQNTGTDTAFTVVIRDTLSMDLDVFSVRSGASSHDYTFRMYGPRVLEWTFNNIMLPDSNVNLIGSNGFVSFKVRQVPNLPIGTIIENSASIYFDYNAPIFTNTSWHTIGGVQDLSWDGVQALNFTACNNYAFNNFNYNHSGTYWQAVNSGGLDSLYTLNVIILDSTSSFLSESVCNSYTAPDAQVYTTSGQYTAVIPNAAGCDSTITINLTIKDSSSAIVTETVCNSYTAPDAQVYTTSGQYTAVIPNAAGCDSTITINLTIKDSSSAIVTETICNSYTAPDAQVYTTSGQYTAVIPNEAGCDSTITINLTIKDSSSAVVTETVCNSYTAPDAQVYTTSGQYTAVIPNTVGCDSTITINLTIDEMPTDSITLSGTTLTAYTAGISYQWLDCNNGNAPIAGETSQSFTPLANGDYAVQMTNGTCTLVSSCVNLTGVPTSKLTNDLGILIYPNPTTGILHLDKGNNGAISIQVLDNLGRVLLTQSSNDMIININLGNLASGVYYIIVGNGDRIVREKVVKF